MPHDHGEPGEDDGAWWPASSHRYVQKLCLAGMFCLWFFSRISEYLIPSHMLPFEMCSTFTFSVLCFWCKYNVSGAGIESHQNAGARRMRVTTADKLCNAAFEICLLHVVFCVGQWQWFVGTPGLGHPRYLWYWCWWQPRELTLQ